jgi:hypothetical protein
MSKQKPDFPNGLQEKQVKVEEKDARAGYGNKKLEGPNRPST